MLPLVPQAAPVQAALTSDALDELLGSYGDLRAYLRGRLNNPADAADIAQSSFAQVYAYMLERPVRNARALLFQSARNLWTDICRRRHVEAGVFESWQIVHDDMAPSAERVVSARRELQQLIERIERMPRLRREVFVRVRMHGMTHAEVCAELGISARAVEQHIGRAVFDLSELMLTMA